MERSRTQVLFNYLPGAVYGHPDGVVVETLDVSGDEMRAARKQALLDELDEYVRQWPSDHRAVPLPSQQPSSTFRIEVPQFARWGLWPMLFECVRPDCGRVRWLRDRPPDRQELTARPHCLHCSGRLRQLRYYSAHACGRKVSLYPQRCDTHGLDHIYFEDNRSFRTSRWRCRACGGAPVRNTNFTPCTCGRTFDVSSSPVMRAYTLNDTRAYHAHTITLVDIDDTVFDDFRRHPDRAKVVLARLRGTIDTLEDAVRELDEDPSAGSRMSPEEWAAKEEQLRGVLSEQDLADLKKIQGPRESGLDAANALPVDVQDVAGSRMPVERTAVLDPHLVPRMSIGEAAVEARGRGQHTVGNAIDAAASRLGDLGINDLYVTWEFPVTLAAVGYTRQLREPGVGQLLEFKPVRSSSTDTRTQVYAVSTTTEAALVQLDPVRVLQWLVERGTLDPAHPLVLAGDVTDPATAATAVLGLFGETSGHAPSAAAATTMVHTMAHTMLTSLDDGQVGLAESNLAEWIVPETLTFAVYVNSTASQTLGAMWTLINSRTRQWAERAVEAARTCDNDPLCHQQAAAAACERCVYVTFGCRKFNNDLDRRVLAEFWANA